MREKIKRFWEEFRGGIIAGVIIIGAVWGLLFFSFYDIYIVSRVHIKEARIWANQQKEDAGIKVRTIFFNNKVSAEKKLLDAQMKAMTMVTQSRGNGVKAYIQAIREYWREYAHAREAYRFQMRLAHMEAKYVTEQAQARSRSALQQAKEEYSLIALLLSAHQHKVSGYYYDPASGKLAPIMADNTEKKQDEKK